MLSLSGSVYTNIIEMIKEIFIMSKRPKVQLAIRPTEPKVLSGNLLSENRSNQYDKPGISSDAPASMKPTELMKPRLRDFSRISQMYWQLRMQHK